MVAGRGAACSRRDSRVEVGEELVEVEVRVRIEIRPSLTLALVGLQLQLVLELLEAEQTRIKVFEDLGLLDLEVAELCHAALVKDVVAADVDE